ncbi:aldehyde dehydrogenase family protein [Streptosporangium sp. NPDC000396]|uniref:aldehyde dehydrogenase family protein n=1 Tax=Streptosporangium sp. NPDC000396 TaxID=3366185 RepID=UPI00368B1006
MKIINPATEDVVAEVEFVDAAEVDRAVERARRAFTTWRNVSPGDRARLLRAFASLVEEHAEELAQLEIANAGHTVGNARWEAGNVRDVLNFYAGAPERNHGKQIPVPGGLDVTFQEPLGVVGVIVPWNFPMVIMTWGVAPALAAGNTVIVKPAEWTPLTALRLAELALAAGLPEGVLQVLPGAGEVAGARLVEHPDVAKIVFTGSTEVGKEIAAKCAGQVKRITLELGGKSANVVFADADLEKAAATAPYAVFDNSGQDCCARSRILVERSVYDDFLERLSQAMLKVKIGDPRDESTEMGPLISAEHRDRVASFVTETPYLQGSCPSGPGFWFPATLLTPDSLDDRAFTEEIFGPVVAVVPFDDEAHAVRIANNTQYGLSGSIWTRDVGRALRVARAVEAGNLSVNSHSSVRYWTPFGGFKQSGLGRELGPDALSAFTETKNVFISEE